MRGREKFFFLIRRKDPENALTQKSEHPLKMLTRKPIKGSVGGTGRSLRQHHLLSALSSEKAGQERTLVFQRQSMYNSHMALRVGLHFQVKFDGPFLSELSQPGWNVL